MKGNLRAPLSFALLCTLHDKQAWEEFQPNSSLSLKQGIELCNSYTGDCRQAWPGARFSKLLKLFRQLLGDIILFVSSKQRRLEARNFAVILIFVPFTTYQKTSFTEYAGRNFRNGFSGPKHY